MYIVTPNEFMRIYQETIKLKADILPPFVHVYKENDIYKVYMTIGSCTYNTRVLSEKVNDFLTRFSHVFALAEAKEAY